MRIGTTGGCLFPANTVGEIRCKSTTVPNSGPQFRAVRDTVKEKITLFGSAGIAK